ncbi:alpha/beta fold hydrolase [Rhodococcus sp. BP-316]|uniref:alpha/beta hydrolase n=1 Tax=unclassified Rhodococcus (in: high G+C Gram-positive bacteria) TaxID=192944 RepID=UPI001C9B76FE|nr:MULTISPECIES: alpha/beta fold hydrolase [unclassified Rhodococcus (in: high G+C Gram-positive bacteria)]MBY6683391.1 alpha/beta fold hydrolase [Rhodococcus sp. BP-316]
MSERRDVEFVSGDATCAAWLYRPDTPSERQPIVVLAHGLGGVREMRLDAYAERFTAAGYACLVFDYRHFGASGGEPRQLLDIGLQLEDWASAIAYARTIDGIDPTRVVLWGSSFGGGHVLEAAARDGRVAAVISQCPFTDGLASALATPLSTTLRITPLAVRDIVGSLRGKPPVMVPLAAEHRGVALMASTDALDGYLGLQPPGSAFSNEVAARFALAITRYFPGRAAKKITAPVLFCVCDPDTVAPTKATLRHAAKAPRGQIEVYPYGHFEIYVGDPFEHVVADQIAFLERTVPLG